VTGWARLRLHKGKVSVVSSGGIGPLDGTESDDAADKDGSSANGDLILFEDILNHFLTLAPAAY
jgi:hypothetical protein